jgi:hypothetical protein
MTDYRNAKHNLKHLRRMAREMLGSGMRIQTYTLLGFWHYVRAYADHVIKVLEEKKK